MDNKQADIIHRRWMYLSSSLSRAHLWKVTDKGFRSLCLLMHAPHRELLVDVDLVKPVSKAKLCKYCRSFHHTGNRHAKFA